MTKANLNSLESRQFINRKVFDFKTRKKELEDVLSRSPELSDEMKDAKRRWLTKSMREETWTDEYQKHLGKVMEDSKMIMLFAKQKFWENPTMDQIDEIRTQFYWSEMDYDDIDSHTDLLNNKEKLWQFIVDKFWDSEKTLILLAQYDCRSYLERTFFDQSSLVQQWRKFFNEPLWSEYDSLTTPESVRYHYWNTLQADIVIFKKFWERYPSSELNRMILSYFVTHADKWTLNKEMIKAVNFEWAYEHIDKFDEDAQEKIQKIKQKKEEERREENKRLAEKRRLEEEQAIAQQAEKEKEERAEKIWKVTKTVTFPIWWPIAWVALAWKTVVDKIHDYNSPYAKRKRKRKREERRQRSNNENE